jgi:hypothetical protein
MKPRYPWRPMQRATSSKPLREDLIALTMEHNGQTREEAIASLEKDANANEVYVNDIYQVQVRELSGDGAVQLNIRRRDGGPILRDWRHFQNIKNELIGPECEAVELYPAESRLVDTCNKFHLWGVRDPTYRFPMGFEERDVDYTQRANASPGLKQRPL